MSEYDLIVIGAGPGGYPSAIRGAQLGLKTACVERESLGGVCLNWGCVPSKALLKSAEMVHKIGHAKDYGIAVESFSVDFAKVVARSRKVSKRFVRGVGSLFKKYGVEKVDGTGKLLGGGKVLVTAADGSETTLSAKHIVVATGARARFFPGIEPDGERILTYREMIVTDERPDSIVILGAGAIGVEFAYFLNAMGTKVTLVEGQSQILPVEDHEMGTELRKHLTKQGIDVRVDTFCDSVARNDDGCVTTLKGGETLQSHTVLISLGITPNTEGIGLQEAGVATERGFISVDSSYRTNVPGVYAVGDVCGRGAALAHTATRQAHVCVERIAGHEAPDVDDDTMPSCTYCQPQVASVGMTEREVKRRGIAYKVGKFPFMVNAKSQGAGTPEGFVKVLVGEQYGELLGAHIIGADATEMIANFAMARSAEATAELFVTTVHAHPTSSEVMLEAVASALGVSVHM